MRIRLWNAFASNNSGSYTIVGTFREPATAAAAAVELQRVCEAETEWRRQYDPKAPQGPQPMVELARRLGIGDPDEAAGDDEWPDMAYATPPGVTHTRHQVELNVPYTVTMPRVLGQLLYHRGGRVDVELEHAHHPIVVDLRFHPDWRAPDPHRRLRDVHAVLRASDSPLHRCSRASVAPVVRIEDGHGAAVRALAVLADLISGIAAMNALATAHGVELHVRLLEADHDDPLRPWR